MTNRDIFGLTEHEAEQLIDTNPDNRHLKEKEMTPQADIQPQAPTCNCGADMVLRNGGWYECPNCGSALCEHGYPEGQGCQECEYWERVDYEYDRFINK